MIKKMISILFLVICSQQSSGAARSMPDSVHAAAIQPSPGALRFEDLSEPVPQWDPMPIMMDLPYCLHYGPDRRVEPASSNSYRVQGRELRYGILPRPSSLPDGAPRLFEIVGAKSLLPGGNFRNAFHEWAIDDEEAARAYLFDRVRIFSPAGLFVQDSDGNTPLHLAIGSMHFTKALQMAEVILTSNFGEKGLQEILGLSNGQGETVLQQALHALYYSLLYGDSEEVLQPLIQFIQLTAPLVDLDKRSEHDTVAPEFQASPREFFATHLAQYAESVSLRDLFLQAVLPATAAPVAAKKIVSRPLTPPPSSYATIAAAKSTLPAAENRPSTTSAIPKESDGSRASASKKEERHTSNKPKPKARNRPAQLVVEIRQHRTADTQVASTTAATVNAILKRPPQKAAPTVSTKEIVKACFDEESDDAGGETAQDAGAAKPVAPAAAPAPTDDGEAVLWKALEEKNLRTLAQWLRVKANQVRLKTGRLWNAAGETPLYKALSLEFYKGADALVAAAPHCLMLQKNRDNAETPLTFIFDHANIRQLKELFQLWYSCGEIDPTVRVAGQSIEQKAMASGLLEPDQMETPTAAAPLPSRAEAKPMPVKHPANIGHQLFSGSTLATAVAGLAQYSLEQRARAVGLVEGDKTATPAAAAPLPSHAEPNPAPVKPSAPREKKKAVGPSRAMLETLWDADLFFNASRPSVTETRVCRAIESNNTNFLKNNEAGVQAYQRFMQRSFFKDYAHKKVWSLNDKYPIALWLAFLAGATDSFSYFLSKVDDINPLLFYAEDSSSIFGWLLEPAILRPAFLSLGRRGETFSYNSSRIAMLAQLFNHQSFDYHGRLYKKLAHATDENFISRFIQGLIQVGVVRDVGDVDVLSKLVYELLRAGVPWGDIADVIETKYSDNVLAQALMLNIGHLAMGLYIKNDLKGFLRNYPCPVGMMATYGFLACIEDLVNGGVGSDGNVELLTGAVDAKFNDSMTVENALSILLLHRPLELQKEWLPKYLTWAPLEKWLEPFNEERRAELLEKIKAVEAARN